MQIFGKNIRNTCVIIFDTCILAAFPCHSIESPLFWTALGGLMAFSALTVIVLELLRFMAPDLVAGWWAPQ